MAEFNDRPVDDYVLNRDWRAVSRLHHRHMLFRIVRGYILHSSVQLGPDAKIADIGAGTCIWAIDVLHGLKFPVTVDAIDISMAYCPPKSWLPKNIKLIKTLIRNLIGLLKPGGFLQWTEQTPDANRIVVTPGVSTSTMATKKVLNFLESPPKTIGLERVSQLADRLAAHARVEAFHRYESLNEHQLWSIGVLQACEKFASNLERNGQSMENAVRAGNLRSAADKAAVEMLNGVGAHSGLVVAAARKDDA